MPIKVLFLYNYKLIDSTAQQADMLTVSNLDINVFRLYNWPIYLYFSSRLYRWAPSPRLWPLCSISLYMISSVITCTCLAVVVGVSFELSFSFLVRALKGINGYLTVLKIFKSIYKTRTTILMEMISLQIFYPLQM